MTDDITINQDEIDKSLYIRDGMPMSEEEVLRRRGEVERTFLTTSAKEIAVMSIFAALMLVGFGYYLIHQFIYGLTDTNLSQKVFWGAYITSFVFWIGVSHVGMLISAVLRMFNLKYRTPITRMAEEVTIVSLVMGAASVLIDMGRLDRAHHILVFANITSPLVWDVISITFYLTGSMIFFITPLIPDMAYYRDNLDPEKHRLRVMIYKFLAFNFKGTPEQYEHLNGKIMERLKFIILPVAFSVHTVVSWIFAVTWRPGWKSTIFGPYFIFGAVFSGTAALISLLVAFTVIYDLEDYITAKHIRSATFILIVTNLGYMYFTINEYIIGAYQSEVEEMEVLRQVLYGDQSLVFWFIIWITMAVPLIMNFYLIHFKDKKWVYIWSMVASILVNIGAWLKRWVIIIPTLRIPVISEGEDAIAPQMINGSLYPYFPSTTEIMITIAQFAFFIFFYWFLNKLIPLIPIWEVEHEWEVDGLVDGKTPQRLHEESWGQYDRSFLHGH